MMVLNQEMRDPEYVYQISHLSMGIVVEIFQFKKVKCQPHGGAIGSATTFSFPNAIGDVKGSHG